MAGTISGNPNFSAGLTVSSGQVITTNTINPTTANAGIALQGIAGSGVVSSGNVGEIIISTFSSISFSGSFITAFTSITLTPGCWDLSAYAILFSAGTTFSQSSNAPMVINNISASSSGTTIGLNNVKYIVTTGAVTSGLPATNCTIPSYRVNLATAVTYYLNMDCAYTSSNPNVSGTLRATRIA